MPPDAEGGQLQTRDPALSAPFQRRHLLRREVQPHHLVEKGCGLARGEAQVGRVQLAELPPPAQQRDGQRGVGPAGEGQVHLRRHVVEQKGDRLVDGGCLDQVVVVQDEDKRLPYLGDVIDQAGE